jgi:hypothetical protein
MKALPFMPEGGVFQTQVHLLSVSGPRRSRQMLFVPVEGDVEKASPK